MQFNFNACAFNTYEDAQRYYDFLTTEYECYKSKEVQCLEILKVSCSIEDLTEYQYAHDFCLMFKSLKEDFFKQVLQKHRKELVISSAVELRIKKYLGKKAYERYMKNYVARQTH